jgi:hypothetical protein
LSVYLDICEGDILSKILCEGSKQTDWLKMLHITNET